MCASPRTLGRGQSSEGKAEGQSCAPPPTTTTPFPDATGTHACLRPCQMFSTFSLFRAPHPPAYSRHVPRLGVPSALRRPLAYRACCPHLKPSESSKLRPSKYRGPYHPGFRVAFWSPTVLKLQTHEMPHWPYPGTLW